jgi:hypothetical protein
MVEGATHAFDGRQASRSHDPLALDGKGAWITITPDPKAAQLVRQEAAAFLLEALKPAAR